MNSQWKNFLESNSATIQQDGMVRFGQLEQAPACALCDLSYLGLISVSGPDAADFLQGQFTNDIRELGEDNCQLSAYCNPKGRMFANFWLFRQGDAIFMQLPRETLGPVLKRLSMFLLRSKATLTDVSDELVRIGMVGEQAESQLQNHFAALPDRPSQLIHQEGLTLLRLPGLTPRFEIIGEAGAIAALWGSLGGTTPTDSSYWPLQDIRAGIPTVYAATAEAFIPQMVNMQLVQGVSFTKGCYCGQEIVARTQYRGTLKRRMYLAHVTGDRRPLPGEELTSPSAEHDQMAGQVVDAQPAPEGGYDALVMAQIAGFEANDIRLGDNGPLLELGTPPYPFEDKA
jgi:folate-binding protein YgfZ